VTYRKSAVTYASPLIATYKGGKTMKISVARREYLIEIEVRKFTPKTIRCYRNNLDLFLRFCEEEAHIMAVEEMTLAVVRQFSLFMSARGKKGSYINGLLKVAKAFVQYCYDEG
jgi:site-specific recombinase XerD